MITHSYVESLNNVIDLVSYHYIDEYNARKSSISERLCFLTYELSDWLCYELENSLDFRDFEESIDTQYEYVNYLITNLAHKHKIAARIRPESIIEYCLSEFQEQDPYQLDR